ncbi:Rho-GTPase-activating protein 8 [Malassezia equina]|uniref:Rho-GTPase-activating protein 8 n=1 Tax=Malassezia equina TaxID=1381935 RepID=A0AAF0ECG5_9BASI|nr:Rho-GTPase-activating protein 8 [Malassezia equina]
MTSPAHLDISYPPTFTSSFWTYPEYRKGAVVLYSRLQEGLDENESLLTLVRHRAEAEAAYVHALSHPPTTPCVSDVLFPAAVEPSRPGYRGNDALSSNAIRQLTHDMSHKEGERHTRVAQQLQSLILGPFGKWAYAHADRVHASWHKIDNALLAMERQTTETAKRRNVYETRSRQADEAEEDVRFAPTPDVQGTYARDASGLAPMQPEPPRAVSMPLPSAPSSDTTQESTETKDKGAEPESRTDEAQKLKRRETLRQQFGFKPRTDAEPPIRVKEEGESATHRRQESRLSSYWNLTMGKVNDSQALAQVKAAVTGLAEPRHIRLRREAEAAEVVYRESVKLLDSLRSHAEETLFHEYRLAQKWEMDRVTAVQRVLSAFHHALGAVMDVQALTPLPTLAPRVHVEQLMAAYRTGPFRPVSTVFKPYYHDDGKTVAGINSAGFGMDLLSAAKGAALTAQASLTSNHQAGALSAMPTLPPVLHVLLTALQRSYADRTRWLPPSGKATEEEICGEKRRIWLYDVPLSSVHQLRRQLIEHYDACTGTDAADMAAPDQLLDAVSAPVLAATVKLWLLELDAPLIPYTLWDEVAEIYEAARLRSLAVHEWTSERKAKELTEPILHGLTLVLERLPKLHLACLDAFVAHLYKLMKDTRTNESDDMYTTKLGLSLGRYVLRPSGSLPSTLYAEYPAVLLKDLVTHYEQLLPPLLRAKAKESDMKALSPYKTGLMRHRSMLVDERIKRSSLGGLGLPAEALQRRVTQIGTRYASSPATRVSPHIRPLTVTAPLTQETTPTKQGGQVHSPLAEGGSPLKALGSMTSLKAATNTDRAPTSTEPEETEKADVSLHAEEQAQPDSRLDAVATATTSRPSPGIAHAKRNSISERRKMFETAPDTQVTSPTAEGDEAEAAVSPSRASPSLQRRPRTTQVRGPRGPRQVSR